MEIRRGQIWYADLGVNVGSVQSYIRPVIIIQNNIANKYSDTVTVLPITSRIRKNIPVHVDLECNRYNRLNIKSTVLNEAIDTISKEQLIRPKGIVTEEEMKKIERKLLMQLGMMEVSNV